MAKKKKLLIPKIKKNLKDFMVENEGKISKKDVAKLGITLSMLGVMLGADADIASAGHGSHSQHTNTAGSGVVEAGKGMGGHTSGVNPHASSHSSGGWC